MIERPAVQLCLPARPEGVGVVRQALAGLGDALAVDAGVLADMKMAVTEACTNVVVHAYPGATDGGVLHVDLLAEEDALTVAVRDRGAGMRAPGGTGATAALGLGLPLIAALSDEFEVRDPGDGGTEVRMRFAYVRGEDPAQARPVGESGWELPDRG